MNDPKECKKVPREDRPFETECLVCPGDSDAADDSAINPGFIRNHDDGGEPGPSVIATISCKITAP